VAMTNRYRSEWDEYSRKLIRRIVTALAGICTYPALVILAVGWVTWYIRPENPGDAEIYQRTILGDALTVVTILFTSLLPAFGAVFRLKEGHRWYRICDTVVRELERGRTLAGTVQSYNVPETQYLDEALRTGSEPARILSGTSCPDPLVRGFAAATGERDLQARLNVAIREYQEKTMERIGTFERFAQPAAIAVAGGAVLWLVIRLVIPYMIARLDTGVL
jgi:hypothetical protein